MAIGALVGLGVRGAAAGRLAGAGRFLGRNAGNIAIGAGALRAEGLKQIPRIEDEAVVEVVGQPGATKKQLYYLALATAFGLLRRYDVGFGQLFLDAPTQAIMVEYDAADNWVRATVRYNTGLASAATVGSALGSVASEVTSAILQGNPITNAIGSFGANQQVADAIGAQVSNYYASRTGTAANALYAQAVVYSGPRDDVVGGAFNFFRPAAPGILSSASAPGVPRLPFAGQAILTTQPLVPDVGPLGLGVAPTPNPKPPGDNRSRGTFPVPGPQTQDPSVPSGTTGLGAPDYTRLLIPLVFAALSAPASADQAAFVQPVPGPAGG